MDETEKKQSEAGGQAPTSSDQSVKEDLKKVADRAKAATGGFSFNALFEGRLDEKNYLYFAVAGIVLGLLLNMIPLIGMLISIAIGVLGLGATARRFHDINITGWAAALLIVPIIGLLTVIYLCWKKGDTGANPFGGVPDKNRDMFKAILNTN